MTVETLHDALTLLPEDLIAEADQGRSRKQPVIQWRRWTAMAACLILIFGCGLLFRFGISGNTKLEASDAMPQLYQAAPQESPVMENSPESRIVSSAAPASGAFPPGILDISLVETPLTDPDSGNLFGEPEPFLFTQREALDAYLEEYTALHLDTLEEAASILDAHWFTDHDLLLIRLNASPETTVTDIQEQDEHWEIYLNEPAPESSANIQHILITARKGLISDSDHVAVFYALP